MSVPNKRIPPRVFIDVPISPIERLLENFGRKPTGRTIKVLKQEQPKAVQNIINNPPPIIAPSIRAKGEAPNITEPKKPIDHLRGPIIGGMPGPKEKPRKKGYVETPERIEFYLGKRPKEIKNIGVPKLLPYPKPPKKIKEINLPDITPYPGLPLPHPGKPQPVFTTKEEFTTLGGYTTNIREQKLRTMKGNKIRNQKIRGGL